MSIIVTVDNVSNVASRSIGTDTAKQYATYTITCTNPSDPSATGMCRGIRYEFHFPAQDPPPSVAMYKEGKPIAEAIRLRDETDRLGRPLWRFTIDEPVKMGNPITLVGPINGFVDQDDLSLLNETRDELIGKRLSCNKIPQKKGLLICQEQPSFFERLITLLKR